MLVTLELAPDEEARLRRKAARNGMPAEEYALTALRSLLQQDETDLQAVPAPEETLADSLKHYIGLFDSSQTEPMPPTEKAKEFTDFLVEKYRKQGLHFDAH